MNNCIDLLYSALHIYKAKGCPQLERVPGVKRCLYYELH
jgi:hypothetical protein